MSRDFYDRGKVQISLANCKWDSWIVYLNLGSDVELSQVLDSTAGGNKLDCQVLFSEMGKEQLLH